MVCVGLEAGPDDEVTARLPCGEHFFPPSGSGPRAIGGPGRSVFAPGGPHGVAG